MKRFRVLAIGVFIAVCGIMFAGCLFQGEHGLSAYELAVKHGYEGTEAQWVAQQYGREGNPGKDGVDAVDGQALIELMYYLWDNEVSPLDKTNKYGNDILNFIAEYFKGERGESGNDAIPNVQDAANIAVRSAVSIIATVTRETSSGTVSKTQAGSGVIYKLFANGNAYIITNYHVVSHNFGGTTLRTAASGNVSVFLYGMPDVELPARVIGGSPEHDIAVLEVVGSNTVVGVYPVKTVKQVFDSVPVQKAAFLDESKASNERNLLPAAWSHVIAVGNPLSEGLSVTDGIISVQSEEILMESLSNKNLAQMHRVMRTSAAINPGNSGGGLFNIKGELVGIVNARTFWNNSLEEYPVDNMAYAIPLDVALRIADQIIERVSPTQVIQLSKKNLGSFSVFGENATMALDADNNIVLKETVIVELSGTSGLAVDTVITSMTVNGVKYNITRAYQVYDLLIEAWGKTLTFNQ